MTTLALRFYRSKARRSYSTVLFQLTAKKLIKCGQENESPEDELGDIYFNLSMLVFVFVQSQHSVKLYFSNTVKNIVKIQIQFSQRVSPCKEMIKDGLWDFWHAKVFGVDIIDKEEVSIRIKFCRQTQDWFGKPKLALDFFCILATPRFQEDIGSDCEPSAPHLLESKSQLFRLLQPHLPFASVSKTTTTFIYSQDW